MRPYKQAKGRYRRLGFPIPVGGQASFVRDIGATYLARLKPKVRAKAARLDIRERFRLAAFVRTAFWREADQQVLVECIREAC